MNTLKKSKKNKKLHSNTNNTKIDVAAVRQEVAKLLDDKMYNAAMEKIIALFDAGHTDYDLMIDLSNIYFNTRDLKRAETWANNSLKIKDNMQAYLILAKVYNENNDNKNMAEALDKALSFDEKILNDDTEVVDDMLLVIELSYDEDEIKKDYPHIAKKMASDEDNINLAMVESDENTVNDSSENLVDTVQDNDDSIEKMIDDELALQNNSSDISDTLGNSTLGNNAQQQEESEIENTRIAILQECSSLAEKIKKLNAAAAKYYFDNNLIATQSFLETAYTIDAYDESTLRNLTYLSLQQKDKEKALDYALKMPIVDLELLDKIKNH